MAENIPGENDAQSQGSGSRTIKLTPLNAQTPQDAGDTSTVKVSRGALKPQVPKAVAPGELEKTQAIPVKGLKPVASAQPVSSPFMKKLEPKVDTSTKGIPLSGVASVPKPEEEDFDQTATVRLNRPAPRPMATHSTPISTKSKPIPVTLGAKPPAADATTVKLTPVSPAPTTATGGIKVGTSTTGIKLNSIPAKKINLAAPVATSTTGIKVGTSTTGIKIGTSTTGIKVGTSTTGIKVGTSTTGIKVGTSTTGIKVGTSTTGIKLGAKPVAPGAATIKLNPQTTEAPQAEVPESSAETIKIDGVPTPGASTVKLKSPVIPAAPVEPPSLDKAEETPADVSDSEEAIALGNGANAPAETVDLPEDGENVPDETVSIPEEKSAEEGTEGETAEVVAKIKKSEPGENPHWLFTVSSCVAMVCLIFWALLLVVQFLNQWQGMEIQLPGLQFLSLGK